MDAEKTNSASPANIKAAQKDANGDYNITVNSNILFELASELKEVGFDLFLFLGAVDYPDSIKLVYRVYSTRERTAIFIKTEVPKEEPAVDSLVSLWPAASWHEREAYDLFGVKFKGHPDLRRIFMPDDWVGHPLRKDYSDDRMIVWPE